MNRNRLANWKIAGLLVLPFLLAAASNQFSSPTSGDLGSVDSSNLLALRPAGSLTNSEANPATNVAMADPEPAGISSNLVAMAAQVPQLTPGTTEIIRLAQAGVSEAVMLAYVQQAGDRFGLTPDQIIYLNDIGIPGTVAKAMLDHDAALTAAMGASAPTNAPAEPPQIYAMQPPPAVPMTGDATQTMEGPPSSTAEYVYNATPDNVYAAPEIEVNNFYGALAPYGSWVTVADYGQCWQPTVGACNPDWQPYCQGGQWIFTDCGWYWRSSYSWGWGPFHYGRWAHTPHHGWVWCPDSKWAPAWVCWRKSGDFCGWAPLPPGTHFKPGEGWSYHHQKLGDNPNFAINAEQYVFVPVSRLAGGAPEKHRVTIGLNPALVQRTEAANRWHLAENRLANDSIVPKWESTARAAHVGSGAPFNSAGPATGWAGQKAQPGEIHHLGVKYTGVSVTVIGQPKSSGSLPVASRPAQGIPVRNWVPENRPETVPAGSLVLRGAQPQQIGNGQGVFTPNVQPMKVAYHSQEPVESVGALPSVAPQHIAGSRLEPLPPTTANNYYYQRPAAPAPAWSAPAQPMAHAEPVYHAPVYQAPQPVQHYSAPAYQAPPPAQHYSAPVYTPTPATTSLPSGNHQGGH